METLSLYELNALVRQALERQVSATYWVQAELSDVRVNASRRAAPSGPTSSRC